MTDEKTTVQKLADLIPVINQAAEDLRSIGVNLGKIFEEVGRIKVHTDFGLRSDGKDQQ